MCVYVCVYIYIYIYIYIHIRYIYVYVFDSRYVCIGYTGRDLCCIRTYKFDIQKSTPTLLCIPPGVAISKVLL